MQIQNLILRSIKESSLVDLNSLGYKFICEIGVLKSSLANVHQNLKVSSASNSKFK
jgi:hypothetical protein